jgi:hypothetical protein
MIDLLGLKFLYFNTGDVSDRTETYDYATALQTLWVSRR